MKIKIDPKSNKLVSEDENLTLEPNNLKISQKEKKGKGKKSITVTSNGILEEESKIKSVTKRK